MKYLAACCVFKDELRYLREWVEYHLIVGVEHLYMVSNDDSPDAALEILKPHIERGEVTFAGVRGKPFAPLQRLVYQELLKVARGQARWLALLDVDEFLLPVEADNVPEVLSLYERHSALAVNWACFGSSGLQDPPELQTAAFRMRLRDDDDENRIFKSIVDPGRVVGVHNPHRCDLVDGANPVDEFGAPVTHDFRNENDPHFGVRLRMNHYRTRSESEFAEKLSRWRDGGHPELGSDEAIREFWERNNRCEVLDECIQRFVPEIRCRLMIDSKKS
ncbi:MAG TPA: glycosyltransferase family 2 protein [Burkholderiales bacterium]|nr:glycosyltransferase family 2 protein [Burkholderiales bacterium]